MKLKVPLCEFKLLINSKAFSLFVTDAEWESPQLVSSTGQLEFGQFAL